MEEIEEEIMKKISQKRENKIEKREGNADLMNCSNSCECRYQQPIINITVSPVINATSEVREKTKNSPASDIIGVVSSFFQTLIGK